MLFESLPLSHPRCVLIAGWGLAELFWPINLGQTNKPLSAFQEQDPRNGWDRAVRDQVFACRTKQWLTALAGIQSYILDLPQCMSPRHTLCCKITHSFHFYCGLLHSVLASVLFPIYKSKLFCFSQYTHVISLSWSWFLNKSVLFFFFFFLSFSFLWSLHSSFAPFT